MVSRASLPCANAILLYRVVVVYIVLDTPAYMSCACLDMLAQHTRRKPTNSDTSEYVATGIRGKSAIVAGYLWLYTIPPYILIAHLQSTTTPKPQPENAPDYRTNLQQNNTSISKPDKTPYICSTPYPIHSHSRRRVCLAYFGIARKPETSPNIYCTIQNYIYYYYYIDY